MQSFRTELENALVENDILDLENKIRSFYEGKTDPEKFRSLRLARGVYGQRQPGVQMVRIKVPYGKLSVQQLRRVADLSDEFSTGNIHLTTRQDFQLHFVSLERTPELWAALEKDGLTMREACGNTVRNVTASAIAGIDPEEPFDVSPYADALYRYFLRHPVGQDMGRKIKIAFSSSGSDTALSFIHDLGFIPRVEIVQGKIVRGFKVLIGGGLGAQPFLAQTAFEFLPADEIIPFTESLLRVFDRLGERNKRHKARLKYLVHQTGLKEILELAAKEILALESAKVYIETETTIAPAPENTGTFTTFRISNTPGFLLWKTSNVFEQKQNGWFAVHVQIPLGNLSSALAKQFALVAERYAANDIRITINQSLLLRFVPEAALPALYSELNAIGLAAAGANAFADITSCPGTDTCNLGISNTTGVSTALEKVIREEFPELVAAKNISIRISGCMNSCGQHALAEIGFHGSSLKVGNAVAPALQLLLGGGNTGNGTGCISEKILKFPSRRAPAVLRSLLSDFRVHSENGESFRGFYERKGKAYFYQLLKPFSFTETLGEEEFIDWNQREKFETAIGIGECAGVKIDLVATLFLEAEEALKAAEENFHTGLFADGIYKAYNAFVHSAKALLLTKSVSVNSQNSILEEFEVHFAEEFLCAHAFREKVLRLNKQTPTKLFARKYIDDAYAFAASASNWRFKTSASEIKQN